MNLFQCLFPSMALLTFPIIEICNCIAKIYNGLKKLNVRVVLTYKSAFLFAILFLPLSHLSNAQPIEWGEYKKNKNGVTVYTNSYPEKDIIAYRGVTKIKSSLSAFVALFNDVPGYQNWIHKCIKSEVIHKSSNTKHFTYLVSKSPLVSDREMLLHFTLNQDSTTNIITVKLMHENSKDRPVGKGLIRVNELYGSWIFKRYSDNQIYIDYQMFVNPGGWIPEFLLNRRAISDPYNTLLKLSRVIQQEKYQKAKFDFIKE